MPEYRCPKCAKPLGTSLSCADCGIVILSHEDYETVMELVDEYVAETCSDGVLLDSADVSGRADAMRFLARHGKINITTDAGRRVIGRWVPGDLNS